MELEIKWARGRGGTLHGRLHTGAWYHSGDWDNLHGSGDSHAGAHGWYFGVEQLLWKENCFDKEC